MRAFGTLTTWNDERGFGFIQPEGGGAEVFVHISAWPKGGGRPRVDERLSFELEHDSRGRPRAVRVARPGERPALQRNRSARRSRGGPARAFGAILTILALLGIGFLAYTQRDALLRAVHTVAPTAKPRFVLARSESFPADFRCDGRTRCSQMTSCAEATYFLRHCPGTRMDGDRDGIPCEEQWCN